MRLFQVVWDYIQGSLLTTKGDLVKRGAAVNARLGVGNAKEVLGVTNDGTDLLYRPGIEIVLTKGDIIKRGAAVAERFSVGAAKKVLGVNDAGDDLEYRERVALPLTAKYSAENGSQITILNTTTTIITLALPDVAIGDIILINGSAAVVKGGTLGLTAISVVKDSGTAVIQFGHDKTAMSQTFYQPASEQYELNVSVFAFVTTAGSLTLKLTGASVGSNGTVGTGNGQIAVVFLRKQ